MYKTGLMSGAILATVFVGTAFAANNASWVSGTGSDANACTRTAPCATFASALAKTNASGTIACIDSGEYGPVTITKSVTINCENAEAIITSTTTTPAITITAAATDGILLRGLKVQGLQTGTTGIKITRAGPIFIEKVSIGAFKNGQGVWLVPSAAAVALGLKDVLLAANSVGLLVDTSNAAGKATGVLLQNTDVASNITVGVKVNAPSSPTGVNVETTRVTGSATGVIVSGGGGLVRLRDSIVIGNQTGLNASGGAGITTSGTNQILDNGTPGTSPTDVGEQ